MTIDASKAMAQAIKKCFDCHTVMCYFHVKTNVSEVYI